MIVPALEKYILLAKETAGCDLAINTVLCVFKQQESNFLQLQSSFKQNTRFIHQLMFKLTTGSKF